MNKKFVSKLVKRMFTGCLVVTMVVSGVIMIPNTAKAAQQINKENGIIYKEMNMSTYWNEQTKTAPVEPGCVFAGWYTVDENQEVTPIRQADGIPEGETTYAKFVPAYVLSVKTQVEAEAETTSDATNKPESTFMRVLSSVDCGNYQNVGFKILLGDKEVQVEDKEITKVYAGLKLSADAQQAIYPENIFGAASDYFTALDLEDINVTKFSTKIYIRPYWTTLDGTKVEGLARNVRVEDKYSDYRYISVPINLLTDGAEPTEVAAGMIEVSYDTTKFDVATDINGNEKIDIGRIMAEMDYVVDSVNGKIKFVGNMAQYSDGDVKADGLYANIRFIRKPEYRSATESDLSIIKEVKEFCDWDENPENVMVW